MTEEIRFKILKILSDNPDMSQRELAQHMGISLGKVNYCLNALKDKGLVKARNFQNNPDKRRYFYVLTPKGIDEKARVTAQFLQRKVAEYEALKNEIAELRREVLLTENKK